MGSNKSRIKDFVSGVGFLFRGFGFFASHPRLWLWAVIPTFINIILLIIMISAFAHYFSDIYAWLSAHAGRLDIESPAVWYMHILDWLLWIINLLFQLLIIILSLILILLVSYAAALIIAGPFNDALSEQVEIIVTGSGEVPFSLKKFVKDLWRIVKMESIKALILLLIPIALFILNAIPAIGGFLYILLTFLFGAWDLGFAFAELPMGRKLAPLSERFAFGMRHKWALMGLGIGFVIPFFYLIFAAPLAVGGTLLYLDRQTEKPS
jgi:CysZ protein